MFKKEEEEESKSWLLRLKDQQSKDLRPILCEGPKAKKEDCPSECTPTRLSGGDEDRMTVDIDPNDITMSNQLEDESLETGSREYNTIEDEEVEVEMSVPRPAKKQRTFMDFISIPARQKNPTAGSEKSIEEMNEMLNSATWRHDAQHPLDTRRQRDDQHRAHINKLQREHILRYALSKTGGSRLVKKDMALLVASLENTNTFPTSLARHFAKLPPFQPPPPPCTSSQFSASTSPRILTSSLPSMPCALVTSKFTPPALVLNEKGNSQGDESPVEEDRSLPTRRRRRGTVTVNKPVRDFINYPCERCRQTGRECLPAASGKGCTECKRSKKGCVNAAKTIKAKSPAAVNKRKDRAVSPAASDSRPRKRPSYTLPANDPDSNLVGTLPRPGPSRVTRAIIEQNPVQPPPPVTPSIRVEADYLLLNAHNRRLEEAKRRRDIAENDVARAREELENVVHRLSLTGKRLQKCK